MKAKRQTLLTIVATAVLLSSLPACLKTGSGAEAEEEEKSFIVGRWAFRRLEATEAAMAEKDYKKAREQLDEMRGNEDLNDHERALMWQKYGSIEADQGDYKAAAVSLAKCLELDALPDTSQRTVKYNLGQLYAITEQYDKAVVLLEEWASKEKQGPPKEIQLMLANAYVQLGKFEKALGYAEAVAKATDTPDENLLLMQLAIHLELKHNERVVELLTELIERFPKKAYWLQLAAAHGQTGDHRRALAVLELAYRQDLLTESPELVRLAQHYLHMELPLKAAELLEKELSAGRVEPTPDNLELLANSWMSAREPGKAINALAKAAKEAKGGELYFRLGQLQMQQESWGAAESAFKRAIAQGELRDVGTAHLLLGTAQYELGQRAAARASFQKAAQSDSAKASAQRWIGVMQAEEESCPTGKEAACKLIPGRQ